MTGPACSHREATQARPHAARTAAPGRAHPRPRALPLPAVAPPRHPRAGAPTQYRSTSPLRPVRSVHQSPPSRRHARPAVPPHPPPVAPHAASRGPAARPRWRERRPVHTLSWAGRAGPALESRLRLRQPPPPSGGRRALCRCGARRRRCPAPTDPARASGCRNAAHTAVPPCIAPAVAAPGTSSAAPSAPPHATEATGTARSPGRGRRRWRCGLATPRRLSATAAATAGPSARVARIRSPGGNRQSGRQEGFRAHAASGGRTGQSGGTGCREEVAAAERPGRWHAVRAPQWTSSSSGRCSHLFQCHSLPETG
eukprot:scaffold3877_cov116-Isochrysis_galbana.AAC.1